MTQPPDVRAIFTGLSAFPLTPLRDGRLDEVAFTALVEHLVATGVDSIGVLGSTGSYAYLSREERRRVIALSMQVAGNIPVMAGIGALAQRDVLVLAEDAQALGADALLLAPVSYQRLTQDEVFDLFKQVSRTTSLPVCVYDNPGTTHFDFTPELYGRIAQLPGVASIKIPPMPGDVAEIRAHLAHVRACVPAHVTLGISGDACAARGLAAGCEAWYSAVAGLFPELPLALARAARAGHFEEAHRLSAQWDPLWALFAQHGSARVIATAAELCGRVVSPCLPLPVQALQGQARNKLAQVLEALALR
ncbi:MAG: dihydrodipicolinate synthase family protein [Castellaniella sp.]